MKPIHMKTLIIIIIIPQIRVEATDLIMVKAVINNLEGSYNETEAKDLNIVNVSFKFITSRGASQHNRTQYSNNRKPYFQGHQTNSYRG